MLIFFSKTSPLKALQKPYKQSPIEQQVFQTFFYYHFVVFYVIFFLILKFVFLIVFHIQEFFELNR